MVNQIVVAGAIIAERKVLVAQRIRPPELAGRWELPGGKVAAGESEPEALARELAEELGVEVEVGERLGDDVELSASMTAGLRGDRDQRRTPAARPRGVALGVGC
jgi:8-oxo-dGTP diphosphatase